MNKFFLQTICVSLFLNLFTISYAEDKQNLASFIIRNYESTTLPSVGSNDAEFVIIEFFDYRCGFCSKQANDFQKLLNNSDNVKIIYVEWPIFGDISETAARIALIIWEKHPDLYFEIHNKFMQLGPRMKKSNIIAALNGKNLDGEQIFNEALKQGLNSVLEANNSLAKSLGLRGTPASVINDSIYPGYIKYETLETLIK
jgi:protein-disulfide isomerase